MPLPANSNLSFRVKRAFLFISLLLCFITSFLPGCSHFNHPDPHSLTFLIESNPANLDPRFATDAQSQHLDGLLFSSLLERDEQMNLHGDLAESWELPDPLTYVFHLRPGVRFHDGRPVTSADVKATFDYILNPANHSPKRGVKDKTAVMGILERGGEVRAMMIPNRRKHAVQGNIRAHVKAGSAIYSDALMSYQGLKEQDFAHQVIDHAEKYVDGQVHTNGLENFWSLVKRGLKGTYISVEPFHLFRYLDEQVYRYNNRGSRETR